jgi:hypothetical protein
VNGNWGQVNRMPVILGADNYDLWLDPGMMNVEAVSEMLKPCDAQTMRSYPVSTKVNLVANDDAECSTPVKLVQHQRCAVLGRFRTDNLSEGGWFFSIYTANLWDTVLDMCISWTPDRKIFSYNKHVQWIGQWGLFRPCGTS